MEDDARIDTQGWYTTPQPTPDLTRDHDCYHYQAPSGQRCGSPALKGEYYRYHHHLKTKRHNSHFLIDPEVTRMEVPPIEDRASIFISLAAIVHRLAENTIDTRRAGQMIYALQVALRTLEPPRVQRSRTSPAAQSVSASQPPADATGTASSTTCAPDAPPAAQLATNHQQLATAPPRTIPITKDSLLYFLRSRHCAHCNAELFPASELTERRNPGAPPEIIEESRPALPAPETPPAVLPTLNAVASEPDPGTSNLEPSTSNLAGVPLPLSAVLLDNERGCAWPDRTSFRRKIQEGQQGPKALCRGVSGGRDRRSPIRTSCLPAEVAGQFRS